MHVAVDGPLASMHIMQQVRSLNMCPETASGWLCRDRIKHSAVILGSLADMRVRVRTMQSWFCMLCICQIPASHLSRTPIAAIRLRP